MTRVQQRKSPSFEINLAARPLIPLSILQPSVPGQHPTNIPAMQTTTPFVPPTTLLQQSTVPTRTILAVSAEEQQLVPLYNANFSASCILEEGLYLGSYADALCADELQARGICRILNVATECDVPAYLSEQFNVLHLKLRDHSDEAIHSCFDIATRFIRDGLSCGEGVIVHCRMGVSRSATIVMAYLMAHGTKPISTSTASTTTTASKSTVTSSVDDNSKKSTFENQKPKFQPRGMSYRDVFDYVKQRRPEISPNFGFSIALREMDQAQGFRTCVWDDEEEDVAAIFEGEEKSPKINKSVAIYKQVAAASLQSSPSGVSDTESSH